MYILGSSSFIWSVMRLIEPFWFCYWTEHEQFWNWLQILVELQPSTRRLNSERNNNATGAISSVRAIQQVQIGEFYV